ncbi:MAG: M15 family metallopeptidase [Bacteroidetes bacterium]|nr:M15 family metallopeptidase [Bacteroidota bacterium]
MRICYIVFLFAAGCSAYAQKFSPSDTLLVSLKSLDSSFVLDIRYATKNNFTKQVLYPVATAKLRRIAAESLAAVQKELKVKKLGLKIFDGYRPLSIQWKLWNIVPNDDYVANPAKGSKHNRGAAVDVTIIDSLGNELEMPTPYDDFTERAWQTFEDLPEIQKQNRTLLKTVMMRHGFLPIKSEWWHFDFHGWEQFSILDEPLE